MRSLVSLLGVFILILSVAAQNDAVAHITRDDSIRVDEFYRVAAKFQDDIWPGWSKVPTPLLLVTANTEFLTHHPSPPQEFKKLSEECYARPRQFPTNFQATFPAFGPPSVIVIGEPSNTLSKTSTPWLFTVMHEHFHQLQNAQAGYLAGVDALGLSKGDTTGMWMLNYPFPYEKPEVARAFALLRDALLHVLAENDREAFEKAAKHYIEQRQRFFSLLSPDDRKYLSFQLWQEGIARYTEVKSAEASRDYQASAEFAALSDYEPFAGYAQRARTNTLDELKQADLPTWKRTVVYSFGAAEGFLLDRINPKWKDQYFKQMFSMDGCFEAAP